jgi:hypothetical protein
MNLERIEKKLREARFFVDQMRNQEGRAFGDKEPFDFFLSAFLNAARTVDYRLRHEQGTRYQAWRSAWNKNKVTPAEAGLITFMINDRNVEVHESGSGRGVRTDEIKVPSGDTYSDGSGRLQRFQSAAKSRTVRAFRTRRL